jgi:hypothetical protein
MRERAAQRMDSVRILPLHVLSKADACPRVDRSGRVLRTASPTLSSSNSLPICTVLQHFPPGAIV